MSKIDMDTNILTAINQNPQITSMLYDLNLLPECIDSQINYTRMTAIVILMMLLQEQDTFIKTLPEKFQKDLEDIKQSLELKKKVKENDPLSP